MKFIFFLLLGLLAFSSQAQSNECDAVHEGTFWVMGKKHAPLIEISRNDKQQTETVIESGEKVNYRVQWISSCQFTLTPLDTNAVGTHRNIVWILKIKKDYYTYKTTQLFRPEITGQIARINAMDRSKK